MKQLTVIAYDSPNNKRRKRIADLLSRNGVRMNYSVFECFLPPLKLNKLIAEIEEIIKLKEDSILIYPLSKNGFINRRYLGNTPDSLPQNIRI